MYQPRRHGTGLQTDADFIAAMPNHGATDLFWIRDTLAAPKPPMVENTGLQRPERGTIRNFDGRRDYPMSTHNNATTTILRFGMLYVVKLLANSDEYQQKGAVIADHQKELNHA
jgi:hypothetical protein